ncbi:hypothetical protein [Cyclobacterium amurskyense]|uniref:hypothetical protein n=1 Tax=Cyclobacterium amurskyense TaxID=320787 RepID=UPI0030DB846D|tara:strand:- start:9500 stop:10675 length:1176 start_codon:yes stop_codon:yes gene_type:complete
MKYFILLSLILISCDLRKRNTELTAFHQSNEKITFVKLDSIKIDYLGNPTVHDIDPISKRILFMEHKETSQIISMADFDGSILTSFSKWGDVPDSYGNLIAPLKFHGSNSFLAYGSKGYLTYNFEGKLQHLVKHSESPNQGFSRIGFGLGLEETEDLYLYFNPSSQTISNSESRFYEKHCPLILLNPKTGDNEPIISFPETSIFRNGKYFFSSAWEPSYTVSDNLIYVVFGVEPTIYLFQNTKPHSLVSKILLDLPDYRYYKGSDTYSDDVRFFGHSKTSGKIRNINKLDKYFIIAYFPGYERLDIEEAFISKSPEEARLFWDRMREKYPHRIAIFDTNGNRLNDFEPMGLIASSMVLRNGELWMMEKPNEEIEQDYFQLFRVGLKVEHAN